MRKIVFVMSIVALCMFGCSASDDELQIENEVANEMSALDFERVHDMIQLENAKLSSKSTSKSKNNGNGVYSVPFYSNNLGRNIWYAFLPIQDENQNLTHWLVIDFPQNGDDRAIVFSETEMMVNYTSHGPRMYIFEPGVGVVYSNWCDENKKGIYTIRGRTTYIPVDQDSDGVVDYYWWGPNAPGTVTDKNFLIHVKSALTDTFPFSQEGCIDPTESVDFSYNYQAQNGKIKLSSTIK